MSGIDSPLLTSSAALRKRKTLKKGINFTIMVVGQSGTGRSTFINTLCGKDVVECSSTIPEPEEAGKDIDLDLRDQTVELEDDEGVRISLNIIDTPGFGDNLDNEDSFGILEEYITKKFDEILLEESRVRRNPRFKDGRVHALIYMIVPTGHGLREIDVQVMKRLGKYVNIIPVISKADSLLPKEVSVLKKLIMEDIKRYQIPIYSFPFDPEVDDEESINANSILRSLLPFAIVGSNEVIETSGGLKIRARTYPWGYIDVDDPTMCDFTALRNALLISHLQDLREYTHEILYEKYRTDALSGEVKIAPPADSEASHTPNISKTGDTTSDEVSIRSPAPQSDAYMAREEQIRLEEERLRLFEERVQRDLIAKRQELLERERQLKEMEEKLAQAKRGSAVSENAQQV